MAVTLKDIAERTGVSPSVVSTVLSGRDNGTFVSENTRKKVLQVAEMLNYTPVRSGRPRGSRRLRRQRTEHFIGLWDREFSPYSAHYVHFLQRAFRKHAEESEADADDDFGLRLLTAEDLPRLDALGVMGFVLLSPALLPREAAAATIPSVMIGEVDNPPRDLVQVHGDDYDAGRQIGEYLWSLGHRRIAFVAPGAFPRVTRQRFEGLRSAWIMHHGDPANVAPAQYDLIKPLGERDQIRRTVLGLFGPEAPAENRPTALVCYDENVAAITAQALAEVGCRVPADVSLAAFNDTPRIADSMIPALTTIRYPVAQITEEAIEQLYLVHDGLSAEGRRDIAFPGELVIRSSCARPAEAPVAA
jgi:DNA-binding LacI/PurR family transcriptional regulator